MDKITQVKTIIKKIKSYQQQNTLWEKNQCPKQIVLRTKQKV